MAAHTVLAAASGAPRDVVDAIRAERPVADSRLGALSVLARLLVEQRGWLGEEEVADFVDAGFETSQILEVVAAVALKTISNYANHLADTPLDPEFRAAGWTPSRRG